MVGVNLCNGNPSQLNEFKFVTQVKFQLLQMGTNDLLPRGLGVENVVVDPDGIVQGIRSIEDRGSIVDLINTPSPVSELKPKSLYYGLSSIVGYMLSITETVENSGLLGLEVASIQSSTDQVQVDRSSFTVAPKESKTFTVALNPTQEGNLSGNVTVSTNDRTWTLPFSSILIEGGLPPAITLVTDTIDYGTVEVRRSGSQSIQIKNDGLGPLTVTGIESDLAGVAIAETSFTVGAGRRSRSRLPCSHRWKASSPVP